MVGVITAGVATLGPELLEVAGVGIVLSATVVGVIYGWRLMRSIV